MRRGSTALREELARRGLDGFVVPISDEHMSEYVGAYAQRLAWLTGFGGSAGTAAVLKDKAAIFVDGRYTVQVRDQVDGRLYEYQVGAADQPRHNGSRRTSETGAQVGLRSRGCTRTAGSRRPKPRSKEARAELVAGRQQPDRRGVGRPRRALARARVRPGRRVRRPIERRQARRSGRVAQAQSARCRGDQRARFGRLAAQHARRRCRAHAGGAVSYVIAHDDGTADCSSCPKKSRPSRRGISAMR